MEDLLTKLRTALAEDRPVDLTREEMEAVVRVMEHAHPVNIGDTVMVDGRRGTVVPADAGGVQIASLYDPDLAERVLRWRSDYAARHIGLDGLAPEVRERMVLDWVHQLEGFGSGLPMIEAMVRHHAERGHVLHGAACRVEYGRPTIEVKWSTPEGVITATIGAVE